MLHKIIKGVAPAAALVLAAGLSGCNSNLDIKINDSEGVPLAKLDMSGDPPTELVLAGPDQVVISDGDALAIDVEGDPAVTEKLRFTLEDGTLGIMREKGNWKDKGTATIRVTMPAPKAIVLAGSGKISAQSMADQASVTIAGSGEASASAIAAEKLEVTIAGSGTFMAAGTAKALELTIAGSGSGKMAGLKADSAEITIAGSGSADFASDGKVEASIMGSGDVNITGNATCEVSSMGSGKVRCQATAPEAGTSDAEPKGDAAEEAADE
ncbi:MAG: head GIN domain-containing protein [Sphingomonadaceae bacterium]|nr:DUF2807 domain-containing protein [Sphingomonadaceae bacterium]